MTAEARDELIALAHEWDRAMTANDADAIGCFMADEWTITGSDGKGWDKASFLEVIRSGALTHDVMTSEDIDVRVYGDAALVRARGVSGGTFHGQAFREAEQSSSLFVRQGREWKCVLSFVSRIPSD
jgi:ketosteroid isomerase-like protein